MAAKSKEVKTGCSLAESSKEGCGSKRAGLPMVVMMCNEDRKVQYHFLFIIP
jgi:hypothetical protein